MGKQIFNLLPLNWQFFSAIATFLAVLVALFLPFFRDRKKLKIHSMISFIKNSTSESSDGLSTIVTNTGRTKITIVSWGVKLTKSYYKKTGDKFSTINPEIPNSLPKTLDHMDYVTFWSSSPLEVFKDIYNIFVIDSSGKYWYLSRWKMKKLKKEFKEHEFSEWGQA